jgi:hypothetical protein
MWIANEITSLEITYHNYGFNGPEKKKTLNLKNLSVPRDFHIFYKNLDHNCT